MNQSNMPVEEMRGFAERVRAMMEEFCDTDRDMTTADRKIKMAFQHVINSFTAHYDDEADGVPDTMVVQRHLFSNALDLFKVMDPVSSVYRCDGDILVKMPVVSAVGEAVITKAIPRITYVSAHNAMVNMDMTERGE